MKLVALLMPMRTMSWWTLDSQGSYLLTDLQGLTSRVQIKLFVDLP